MPTPEINYLEHLELGLTRLKITTRKDTVNDVITELNSQVKDLGIEFILQVDCHECHESLSLSVKTLKNIGRYFLTEFVGRITICDGTTDSFCTAQPLSWMNQKVACKDSDGLKNFICNTLFNDIESVSKIDKLLQIIKDNEGGKNG